MSLLTFLILPITSVVGQETNKTQNDSSVPALLQESTIKNMISIVSRQVSRRYDLKPEQAQVAREMLEKNTLDFVNKHFNEFVEIVPQMMDMRTRVTSGSDVSPKEVQELSRKLLPIYKEATELIIRENEKFDKILDDQQRLKHQKDMAKMKADVEQTTEKLTRWEQGKYQPGEFLNRRQKKTADQPTEPETLNPTDFDFWELYVKTFIDAFQLDKMQITMAYSVLNDMKAQAQAYRNDHRSEIQEVSQQIDKLKSTTTKPTEKTKAELKSLQAKLDKLNQPLLDMFEKLKEKLMAIPTDAQRTSAQAILGDGEETKAQTQPAENAKK
jgi:iron-sulfur cluster repair protein YtfE (RIC family)